jgi:hypothetical protein
MFFFLRNRRFDTHKHRHPTKKEEEKRGEFNEEILQT